MSIRIEGDDKGDNETPELNKPGKEKNERKNSEEENNEQVNAEKIPKDKIETPKNDDENKNKAEKDANKEVHVKPEGKKTKEEEAGKKEKDKKPVTGGSKVKPNQQQQQKPPQNPAGKGNVDENFNEVLQKRYEKRRLELARTEARSMLIFLKPLIITIVTTTIVARMTNVSIKRSVDSVTQASEGQSTVVKNTAITIGGLFCSIIFFTVGLVALAYFGYWTPVFALIGFSLFSSGGYASINILHSILTTFNINTDWVSIVMLSTNMGALSIIAVGWRSHVVVSNAMKIYISVIIALFFVSSLPQYGVYVFLILLSIWDLVAVLPEKGPLKLLIKYAGQSDRGQKTFGAMAYNGCIYLGMTDVVDHDRDDNNSNRDDAKINQQELSEAVDTFPVGPLEKDECIDVNDPVAVKNRRQSFIPARFSKQTDANAAENEEQELDIEDGPTTEESEMTEIGSTDGAKLGLGDFVFYSLLAANLAANAPNLATIFVTIHLIFVGFLATIILVYVLGRPMPALPISLIISVIFSILTDKFMEPVTTTLFQYNLY